MWWINGGVIVCIAAFGALVWNYLRARRDDDR